MNGKRYISVILPLKLEWEPFYSTEHNLSIGNRVKVAFSGKEYVAVVSSTTKIPDIDTKKIKNIISVENNLENISAEEIEFWRWIAQYYMCTTGEVYKAAYPSGKINLEEARANAREKLLKRKMRVIDSIEAKAVKLRERLAKKEAVAAKAKDSTKTKAEALRNIEQIGMDLARTDEALKKAKESYYRAEKGITSYESPSDTDIIDLSSAQQKALEEIHQAFEKAAPVLLHGVTGSGKTELYISLAKEALSKGSNVLYLVPEIAISRQLEDRLYEHFGESLLTFHSAESAAGRLNTADTIRQLRKDSGKGSYIVLGTRSSLFLPHHNLGLIIVDEEHDNSYKQDSPAPRYNGRDAALMLCQLQNSGGGQCHIILGSATPSLEELYNCSTGRHIKVELKERYHGSEESAIEIIDTMAERRKRGMKGSISRKLMEHIDRALQQNEQVLILRSRRAWASAMQCTCCGSIEKCPHCNVSLSFHKDDGRMSCHYCGYTRISTGKCSKCQGELAYIGAGTQKIEEELSTLFPKARVARLDSDSSQNKKAEAEIIRNFSRGEIDILVGTQMIAKGFDFSNLSLVAIIAADSLLGIQDFRADEKALHTLEQFRGRCGRRSSKGTFVIQTSQPGHPIYSRLSANDTDDFYTQLLQERKDFGFPPYSTIVEISIRDLYEDRAIRMSSGLADALRPYFDDLTGPYAPAVDKIADQHIRMIRINLKKDKKLSAHKGRIKDIIQQFSKEKRYDGHITIDVDPA